MGAARSVSEMQPVLVNPASPGSGLLNAVLALLAPPNNDENERYDEEVLDLAVVGFLVVYVLPSFMISLSQNCTFLQNQHRYPKAKDDSFGP